MSSVFAILVGAGLIAVSGVPAAFTNARSNSGQRLTVFLLAVGSLVGLAGTGLSLLEAGVPSLSRPWFLPWGLFSVAVDRLSAFFLLLVFTVPLLASVYGLGYWKQSEHPENGRRLGAFTGLLTSSMAMIVIARDSVLFLVAWEIMALSAWFTASVEGERDEVRNAGWVYLVATHMGTLTLLAMFALWYRSTGSFSLELADSVPRETAGLIFALAVVGFGFKAGLMPLHVWKPAVYANAPCHVSAIMSGVILKMGIYGIVRVASLFAACEPWWGIMMLIAGGITAVFGIAFAAGQRDIRRLLAYSSVENVGILSMAIGIALLGKALGLPALILLGLGGSLFHALNHALFKSLLFFGAGSVARASGTGDMDALGGLAKGMPATAALFAVGSAAICALPPLNGFAGEWLIYLGMFKALAVSNPPWLPLAAAFAVVLSMVGALTVAVFVRLVGTVFLGTPRTEAGRSARDPLWPMMVPMALIAAVCALLGAYPALVLPLLEGAVRSWVPSVLLPETLSQAAPVSLIALMNAVLAALLGAGCAWFFLSAGKRADSRSLPTWDCGYREPTARVQYTGTSLAQMIVRLFSFALMPSKGKVRLARPFPEPSKFELTVNDAFLDRVVRPVFSYVSAVLPKFYVFQQGQTYLYVLYVGIITAVLFALGLSGVVL